MRRVAAMRSTRNPFMTMRSPLAVLGLLVVCGGTTAWAQHDPAQLPPLRPGASDPALVPTSPVPTPTLAPQVPAVVPPAPAVPPEAGHGATAGSANPGEPAAAHPEVAPAHPIAPPSGFPAAEVDPAAPMPAFGGAHGEPGHGASGHEAAGHGAGHDGPVIENWISWDYKGPGRAHHNPPFLFSVVNFAVFLYILSRLFGRSFREFLATRHREVRTALDRAQQVQKDAEAQLQQINERMGRMESDAAELFASYRKQAEAERQAIVKRAEEEAAGLLRDAEAQAQAAIATAKQQLEQRAAMLAVDLAEKMVRARLNDGDHRRFSDRFVSDLEGIAGRTNSSSHAPTNKESL